MQHLKLDVSSIFQQNFENILKTVLIFQFRRSNKNFRDASFFQGRFYHLAVPKCLIVLSNGVLQRK